MKLNKLGEEKNNLFILYGFTPVYSTHVLKRKQIKATLNALKNFFGKKICPQVHRVYIGALEARETFTFHAHFIDIR